MRRGAHHIQLANPPIGEPPKSDVLGIPIIFDQYSPHVAMARGLWFNRKIVVGPKWAMMDERTAYSVALHEAKHCLSFHMEQRVLGFALLLTPLLLMPWRVSVALVSAFLLFILVEAWFSRQELAADRFAAVNGYGVELLRYVMQTPINPPFYPSFDERCRALEQAVRGERKPAMFHSLLKRLFKIGITANQGVVTGYRQPIGYQALVLTGSAQFMTIPTRVVNLSTGVGGSTETVKFAPGYAVIQAVGTGSAVWRDDGTAPTAAVGMTLPAGGELDYVGDCNNIQFILAAGATITLNISLYL